MGCCLFKGGVAKRQKKVSMVSLNIELNVIDNLINPILVHIGLELRTSMAVAFGSQYVLACTLVIKSPAKTEEIHFLYSEFDHEYGSIFF